MNRNPLQARTTRNAGFTMIELLVTLAIIGILINLLAGPLSRARQAAWNTDCLARLHSLSMLTTLYAVDYKTLPMQGTLGAVTQLDVPQGNWLCRADRSRAALTQGSSYAYLATLYMVRPEQMGMTNPTLSPPLALRCYENNPRLPLYRDVWEFHTHRNAAFFDGQVQMMEAEGH
jgi:prepilin-type N-terminal cleavage/methylation domain-containing protein